VLGPFKVESKPVTLTVEQLPGSGKRTFLTTVLVIFIVAVIAVTLTRRRKNNN
jgi:hypothetical protein